MKLRVFILFLRLCQYLRLRVVKALLKCPLPYLNRNVPFFVFWFLVLFLPRKRLSLFLEKFRARITLGATSFIPVDLQHRRPASILSFSFFFSWRPTSDVGSWESHESSLPAMAGHRRGTAVSKVSAPHVAAPLLRNAEVLHGC